MAVGIMLGATTTMTTLSVRPLCTTRGDIAVSAIYHDDHRCPASSCYYLLKCMIEQRDDVDVVASTRTVTAVEIA